MCQESVEVNEPVILPKGDYVSPGFSIIRPDRYFPNMIAADTKLSDWPYLRREVPHNWYVDQRQPTIGFVNRDEAHILYNTALQFKGKSSLEIGCWQGWSACHLALGGVKLDVIDPLLARPEFYKSVSQSLEAAGILDSVNLIAGVSPQQVTELATQFQRRWSLIFIGGNHDERGPLNDAMACEQFAEADALVLFHDLASPDVARGLDYFKQKGWQTMVYQTMQIMGVAWRGKVEPVIHQPDPTINWQVPAHLQDYLVSDLSIQSALLKEFQEILVAVRPYSLLEAPRLFSLYSLAKQVCLEDIPGNFVECGTCKGGSAALLAFAIRRYSLRPRLLYVFDTFEGMPEPAEIDRHHGISANQMGCGAGALTAPIRENLAKICELLKVGDMVVPVPGLFATTLPQSKSEVGSIALLHADADWYESTMDIFNTFYDSVIYKGIIQIDDYGYWEGCRKAVHDFESRRGDSFVLHPIDYAGVWLRKQSEEVGVRQAQAMMQPAVAFLNSGKPVEAMQTTAKATWLHQKNEEVGVRQAQAMMQQAVAFLDSGKPAAAMRITETAALMGANVPGLHYLRSVCLCKVGRLQEALEAAKAELVLDPTHAQARTQVENLTLDLARPEITIPTQQRPWNTTLPRETMLTIQNASLNYSYRGVPMLKNPFDFALYPLLIWNVKPRTIIEIGSKEGGSAVWLGDMLENFGIDGQIYSIDIVKVTSVAHPRVTFMEGDGRELQKTLTPNFLNTLPHPLLVIEDADHAYETSKHVLEFFHPYLNFEEYIVIEDGILSDMRLDASYNSGPHQALKEFLATHSGEYEIDGSYCDYFGYNLTWCTNGFLKKVTERKVS